MTYIDSKGLSAIYDANGLIYCGRCKHIVAKMDRGAEAYQAVFICKCGECGRIESDTKKLKLAEKSVVAIVDEEYLCPKYDKRLIVIKKDAVKSFSFYIKCSCGAVYSQEGLLVERKERF